MALNYKPLGNRVVLQEIKETIIDKTTDGGLILPSSMTEMFKKCKVVAVGRGETNLQTGTVIPMELKEGDTVLILQAAPKLEMTIDRKEYFLMRENDIEIVLPEE